MFSSKTSKEAMRLVKLGYIVNKKGELINPKGKKVKCGINSQGYPQYSLKNIGVCLHRLVAYQKYGEIVFKKGMEVRHIDGNKKNNSFDNIRIGTHSKNMKDVDENIRIKNGRCAGRSTSKITYGDVKKIRKLRSDGFKYKELLDIYPISKTALSYIVNNKTWKE